MTKYAYPDSIVSWFLNEKRRLDRNMFKTVTVKEKERLQPYLVCRDYQACDYSLANIILWAKYYHMEYMVVHDMLVMKYEIDHTICFTYPMGKGDLKACIEWIEAYCDRNHIRFYMDVVEPYMYEEVKQLFPNTYEFTYCRNNYDYVYLQSDLASLSGRKYHRKKNHLNKFRKKHPEFQYERLCQDNLDEAMQMVKQWSIENKCDTEEEKEAEVAAMLEGMKHLNELQMVGGLIRTKDGVVAVTVGEALNEDTFIIHFEKAFATIPGAYTIINQQFVEKELSDYTYINREDDLGVEGLRRAKLSYNPSYLVEKGTLTKRGEHTDDTSICT